jgi:hypothetical protein
MMMRWVAPVFLVALMAGDAACEPAGTVPATAIGSGTSIMVNSQTDPKFALINVRIDLGTLRQAGDAIEAELTWTLRKGLLSDVRARHPDVTIPEGSLDIYRERIHCRPDGALEYPVERRIVAPGGAPLARQAYDADVEREKAEKPPNGWSPTVGYGSDPRSLVCWAAARKCDGEDFTWPPPKNLTPLENSERATNMRAEYNSKFVPRCQLPDWRQPAHSP